MRADLDDARALFERYAGRVLARCRQLLRDPDDAQDACQEVFVRLIRDGGDFRGDGEWMTWLYRVATNVCLMRLRAARRRDSSWHGALRAAHPEASPSAEAQVSTRALVEKILDDQDEVDQQIALYHFLDGLSQGEIADLVGLSRATVNKRIGALRADAQRWREAS